MRTAANKLGCPPVGPAANIKRFVMRPDADPTFANIAPGVRVPQPDLDSLATTASLPG